MLSIGLCVAGTFDGRTYRRNTEDSPSLYLELKPVGRHIDTEALRVNGLNRDLLAETGEAPDKAMEKVSAWLGQTAGDMNPVLVAYPLAFDWPFISWYFNSFGNAPNPFGHSNCLDIRSIYMAKAGTVFGRSGKRNIPSELQPDRAHTHNALDDAREQADLFSNIFEWHPSEQFSVSG